MNKIPFIIGSVLLSVIILLSIQPTEAELEDDLFVIIDDLDIQNSELILENDALSMKNRDLSHRLVTEHFKKTDARNAIEYLSQFVTEEQRQNAYEIAKQDTASKYWEKRSQN